MSRTTLRRRSADEAECPQGWVATYDSDWEYIGVLNGQLLFERLDQDSIEIGTADV